MAPSIRTRPSFHHSQSFPSESFHKSPILIHQRNENHNHRKIIKLITWTTVLCNSMKLWAMPCRATQDGRVMVENSDKIWLTGEGNGKPLQYSCLENPMTVWKGKKIRHWKMNSPGQNVPNMLLGKSGEITTDRMKRQSQNKNTAHLWMYWWWK